MYTVSKVCIILVCVDSVMSCIIQYVKFLIPTAVPLQLRNLVVECELYCKRSFLEDVRVTLSFQMLYDVPCFFQGGISSGGNPSHTSYPGLSFHLPRWGTRNAKQHDGLRGHAWGPLQIPDSGGSRFLSLTWPKSFNHSLRSVTHHAHCFNKMVTSQISRHKCNNSVTLKLNEHYVMDSVNWFLGGWPFLCCVFVFSASRYFSYAEFSYTPAVAPNAS